MNERSQQNLADYMSHADESEPAEFDVTNPDELARANTRAVNLHRKIIGSEEEQSPGTLPGLAGRLMEHAGDMPGKYDPPTSLSTHTINAIVVGINAYVYERIVMDGAGIDEEETRLLIAALALHDANKYVDGEYDVEFETENNTEQVLDFYFEQGDDFDIKQVLPGETDEELELDIHDVRWLVQRTETKDTASGSRGESTKRVRGLERYCRIGDAFVSKTHADGLAAGSEWLRNFLTHNQSDTASHVHYLSFSGLEQTVLNQHLLAAVQDVIRGRSGLDGVEDPPTHGVILGSTPNTVAYLGEEIDREALHAHVEAVLMDRITDEHEFHAKTEWNSFEYNILTDIGIGFDAKRDVISNGFAETLARGSGTNHEFERVPDEFQSHLPEIAKVVFKDGIHDGSFDDYPLMERLWNQVIDSEEYNHQTKKIGFLAELLRRYMGSVDDGYDQEEIRAEIAEYSDENREALREDLETESRVATLVTDRFFEKGLADELTLPSTQEMCFLCGRPADEEYTKGNSAFYGTNSYSKRVPAEGEYKKICPVCNLEHAILRDSVEDNSYNMDEDIKIAYIYYDDFIADLGIRGSRNASGLFRALQGDEDDEDVQVDIADPELVAASFGRQYHLQPIYVDKENTRLRQIRELLMDLVTNGFKVFIGKPFTGFNPQDALFADLDSTRRQTAYGANRIESYAELERVIRLFNIFRSVADSMDYKADREMTQIQQDDFPSVANLVVQNSEHWHEVRLLAHEHFMDGEDEEKYMLMREIAQKGIDLYGREYSSPYKKTKIFRRAVDATLDGMNRNMSEERLLEHVGGQVYKTALADAKKNHFVQSEQSEAFVTTLFDLLRENGEMDKEELSQRRNALVNDYLYAYEQLLNELSNSEETTAADEDNEDQTDGDITA